MNLLQDDSSSLEDHKNKAEVQSNTTNSNTVYKCDNNINSLKKISKEIYETKFFAAVNAISVNNSFGNTGPRSYQIHGSFNEVEFSSCNDNKTHFVIT